MAKGGSKGKVEGVNLPPTLPLFEESNLPSAKQTGILIAVLTSGGDLKLGVSKEGSWYLFNHDSIVT